MNKKLSCRKEAARCFVFVCSQLQHTYSAVFLLLVTAASDLLVHKIQLNSVLLSLLSPAVSGQHPPPGQTPICHNPPCLLQFVSRFGSGPRLVGRIGSGVRVSVSFQQKYKPGSVLRCPTAAENRRYHQGGCVREGFDLLSSPAYNVEPVTNTSSSSCANNGRRTPRWSSARHCRRSSRLFFTLPDSYGWQHCRPVCSEARYSSRIALPTPPVFDAAVRGFPSEYCHPVWRGKARMAWLRDGEKNSKISLFTNVTDGRTDRQTPHDDTGRAYASHRAAKTRLRSLVLDRCRLIHILPHSLRVRRCIARLWPSSDSPACYDSSANCHTSCASRHTPARPRPGR